MAIIRKQDMKPQKIEAEGLKNVTKTTAVGPSSGWNGWVMRIFSLDMDGCTPRHSHGWDHVNYIIEGRGTLFLEGKENPVSAGDTAFIPAGEVHQFKNTGDKTFSFICIVPEEGDK